MFKIIVLLLTTCLCAIGIYSETANDGFRISPDTYVDDGKQYMEFTCTAYLNEGDQLVWQRGSQSMVLYEKKYGSGFKTIKLTWPLQQSDNDTEIYCARNIKEKNGKFKWVQSKKIPIVFKTVKKTLTDTWGPWVWPVEHVMNNTTLIQLSCWAYLYKNQFVSWYQTSDKNTTERLSMIQQENEYSYVKLDLTKTITLSDDGSNIFCANETFESDHSIKKITESEHIPLTYQTDTEPLANLSRVWVTPDSYTDDGRSVMEFTCHAHLQPTELLSWFQVTDSNTRQRIEAVQEDKELGYKEIKLLKLLEPSDNNTQIYCAKETVSSSRSLKEGPRSQKISISIQREKPYVSVEPSRDIIIFKDDEKLSLICTGSKPVNNRQYTWYIEELPLTTILTSAISLVLVVVVIAVAVCMVRRRRAARPAPSASQAKQENLYANVSRDMASTEMTYAELQFSTPRPRTATNRLKVESETCEYATIVPRSER